MDDRQTEVRSRAAAIFPFAVAAVLPPAGFLLGLITAQQDRDYGIWIMVTAVIAACVWALILLSAA